MVVLIPVMDVNKKYPVPSIKIRYPINIEDIERRCTK